MHTQLNYLYVTGILSLYGINNNMQILESYFPAAYNHF